MPHFISETLESTPLFTRGAQEAITEISVLHIVTILLHRKRLIAGFTTIITAISAVAAWLLPVSFKAQATILPPQQQQSSLAVLASGALGGLGGGMASQLGLKNPSDLYIAILGSRTIADDLIARFQLGEVYGTQLKSETRLALAKHTVFSSGKDSLITITVEDHDKNRAADLANAFVESLYQQNSRLAITDASQRRLFFEQELHREKNELAEAETTLKATQEKTGFVIPNGQVEALIRSQSQFSAEIASREVELAAMRSYATDDNPQVEVLRRQIAALRANLAMVEAKSGTGGSSSSGSSSLPEVGLENVRKMRDVRYHETLYELLAKQYEAARIDEAKQGPVIQIVDRAVIPDHKSWPPRAAFVAIGMFAGLLVSSVWVVSSRGLQWAKTDPSLSMQLHALQKALKA